MKLFWLNFFFSSLEQFCSIPISSGFGYDLTNVILFLFLNFTFFFFFVDVLFVTYGSVPIIMQMFFEQTYLFVYNIVFESTAFSGVAYFPFYFTIFCFILSANFFSLVPYGVFWFGSDL